MGSCDAVVPLYDRRFDAVFTVKVRRYVRQLLEMPFRPPHRHARPDYKALAAEGCNMKYSVAKQDTIYSIVATVRSDRMNFLTKPTMKIRTFTGKYLELRAYGPEPCVVSN